MKTVDDIVDEALGREAMMKLALDGLRWRALMASQRMHYIGSAGFEMPKKDPNGSDRLRSNLTPTPKPNTYMHFGMEFWSDHPAHNNPEYSDSFERELLTVYVDEMIKRGKV